MSRVIRKSKIQGQRMGQLISNALYHELKHLWQNSANPDEFKDKLFYLENDELEKIIQEYIAQLKKEVER